MQFHVYTPPTQQVHNTQLMRMKGYLHNGASVDEYLFIHPKLAQTRYPILSIVMDKDGVHRVRRTSIDYAAKSTPHYAYLEVSLYTGEEAILTRLWLSLVQYQSRSSYEATLVGKCLEHLMAIGGYDVDVAGTLAEECL